MVQDGALFEDGGRRSSRGSRIPTGSPAPGQATSPTPLAAPQRLQPSVSLRRAQAAGPLALVGLAFCGPEPPAAVDPKPRLPRMRPAPACNRSPGRGGRPLRSSLMGRSGGDSFGAPASLSWARPLDLRGRRCVPIGWHEVLRRGLPSRPSEKGKGCWVVVVVVVCRYEPHVGTEKKITVMGFC